MEIIPNDEPKNEPSPPQDIEEPNDNNSVELGDIDDKGNEVVVVTNDEGEQVWLLEVIENNNIIRTKD